MLWLLAAFTLFLLLFAALSFFALYQLFQFGYQGDHSRVVMVGYVAIGCAIAVVAFVVFFIVIR